MPLTKTATSLNQAADAVTIDTIKLHNQDPTATGTVGEIAGTSTAITLGAASGGVRDIDSPVDITISSAETVSHCTLWAGATLKAYGALSATEVFAAAGVYRLTSCSLTVA